MIETAAESGDMPDRTVGTNPVGAGGGRLETFIVFIVGVLCLVTIPFAGGAKFGLALSGIVFLITAKVAWRAARLLVGIVSLLFGMAALAATFVEGPKNLILGSVSVIGGSACIRLWSRSPRRRHFAHRTRSLLCALALAAGAIAGVSAAVVATTEVSARGLFSVGPGTMCGSAVRAWHFPGSKKSRVERAQTLTNVLVVPDCSDALAGRRSGALFLVEVAASLSALALLRRPGQAAPRASASEAESGAIPTGSQPRGWAWRHPIALAVILTTLVAGTGTAYAARTAAYQHVHPDAEAKRVAGEVCATILPLGATVLDAVKRDSPLLDQKNELTVRRAGAMDLVHSVQTEFTRELDEVRAIRDRTRNADYRRFVDTLYKGLAPARSHIDTAAQLANDLPTDDVGRFESQKDLVSKETAAAGTAVMPNPTEILGMSQRNAMRLAMAIQADPSCRKMSR